MLLIGDRAMHSPAGSIRRGLGLGRRMVPLGRVAVRVCDVDGAGAAPILNGLETALGEARDLGVAHLTEIAGDEAAAARV